MALNKRQALFVEKYLKLNNATKAAIEAGYSPKTAYSIGHDLLKKPEIAARLSKRTEKILQSAQMEADEVLTRLTEMARGNIGVLLNVSNGEPFIDLSAPNAPLHLIKRIKTKRSEKFGDEVEIEMYDAQQALNTLGKHWKLFDRANEADWKQELEKSGVKASDLFEQMVQTISEKMPNE